MFKVKKLSITDKKVSKHGFSDVETWANTIDSAIELRAIDADNNPLDMGGIIYLSVRLVENANKIVIFRKEGESLTEIGTASIS
jgi:hypothetical protein